ncbi:MAG: PhzF family phenazine biosynthesis protein [Ilumatobacteraceae bacterium]
MRRRRFAQVDVFGERPLAGNPVAVVLDGDGLDDDEMQALARWTNLSETTFVLSPTDASADYRVRIFTPDGELPFAGHPTLGTAHAWLASSGRPTEIDDTVDTDVLVQECALGPIRLRRTDSRLAFAAPPVRSAEIGSDVLASLLDAVGLDPAVVRGARILDNGPAWHTLLVASSDLVLGLEPDHQALRSLPLVGVVGPHPPGHPQQFEVRAFAPSVGAPEDPVTGSLNAAIGQWLIGEGVAPASYVAAQGTRLGRSGRVHIDADDADVWVGGNTVTIMEGTVTL